ncbi:MAG: DUF1428 domain-containing protein [Patescibacteria group bacterium]
MKYVDGFVLVVPKGEREAYKQIATEAGKIWKKHGALAYFECVGDDLTPDMGDMSEMGDMKLRTFPEMTNSKEDEEVWFSFIIFESKEHRDEVNANVMQDPEMNKEEWKDKPMPFDMEKMAYGGFKVMVEETQ